MTVSCAPCASGAHLSGVPRRRGDGKVATAIRFHLQGSPPGCQSRRHLSDVVHEKSFPWRRATSDGRNLLRNLRHWSSLRFQANRPLGSAMNGGGTTDGQMSECEEVGVGAAKKNNGSWMIPQESPTSPAFLHSPGLTDSSALCSTIPAAARCGDCRRAPAPFKIQGQDCAMSMTRWPASQYHQLVCCWRLTL